MRIRLPDWLEHRRLSLRVLAVILFLSALMTLVITLIQLVVEYRRDVAGLDAQLAQVEPSFAESLGGSLWALDREQLALQLQGIAQLPHVREVALTGDMTLEVGEGTDYRRQITEVIPIHYSVLGNQSHLLGHVSITADLAAIDARTLDRMLTILATQAAKTFAVSVLILWAFYYLVTRHLQSLSGYARQLRLASLDTPVALRRGREGVLRPDEIDEVEEALNHALHRIRHEADQRAELARERARLATVLEDSPAGVVILNAAGVVEYLNRGLVALCGLPAEELLGASVMGEESWLRRHVHAQPDPDAPWQALEDGAPWQGEARLHHAEGHDKWVWLSLRRVSSPAAADYSILLLEDRTSLRNMERRLDFQTHFDPLTELPNRVLAFEHLSESIHRAAAGVRVAVVVLDIDNFKDVNESQGHEAGDRVLVHCADRLRRCCEPGWIVARFSGDQFLVIIPRVDEKSLASRIDLLLSDFNGPVLVDGGSVYLTVSAGVAVGPDAGTQARELVQAADAALSAAKRGPGGGVRFFDPRLREDTRARLALESDLRTALEERQFLLHFQPVLCVRGGHVRSLESLIRWQHPERGLVPPDAFIPLAEANGLIVPIGEWVLRESLRALAQLRRLPGSDGLTVAVNVSSAQISLPGFAGTVEEALEAFGLPPEALQLELTERALIQDHAETRRTVTKLRGIGVGLAIDDFGTGYSALEYLRRLPVSTLKIDREFVRDITTDDEDAHLVRAVISLAHGLRIQVVAEGVETDEQLAFLREHACDCAQGFLLARPMPLAKMRDYLVSFSGSGGEP